MLWQGKIDEVINLFKEMKKTDLKYFVTIQKPIGAEQSTTNTIKKSPYVRQVREQLNQLLNELGSG